jgi:hypothetical protein
MKAQGISSPGTHEAMLMWPCKMSSAATVMSGWTSTFDKLAAYAAQIAKEHSA